MIRMALGMPKTSMHLGQNIRRGSTVERGGIWNGFIDLKPGP